MGAADLPASFHGEQIGVTTLHMARLQHRMLEAGPPVLRPTPVDGADLRRHFGPTIGAACEKELAAKTLSAAELEAALAAAGAPRRGAELGWSPAFERTALVRARQIRNRYTFLDLADEAGRLSTFASAAV
jgi:glycerol-1-phosphate dehydrogenase [NAD(P)+]